MVSDKKINKLLFHFPVKLGTFKLMKTTVLKHFPTLFNDLSSYGMWLILI